MPRPATDHPLPPLPASDASPEERGRAVAARWAARHGAPTIEHFRRVYEQAGLDWPGEDEIRRRHVVATSTGHAAGGSAA